MTKQEKGLWVTVVVLSVGVIFMGTFILRGMNDSSTNTDLSASDLKEPVASIAGQMISEKQWVDALKTRYGNKVLMEMLNRQAVLAEAKLQGLTVTESQVDKELQSSMEGYSSEQAFYDEMWNQFGMSLEELRAEATYQVLLEEIATKDITVSEEAVQEYYEEHEADYKPIRLFDISMIQVDDLGSANHVLERIEAGESFGEVAESESTDEYSRESKGRLGLIEENDPFQPEEMMTLAEEIQIGDVAGPVQVDEHYIIVRLNDIEEKQGMTYEEAMEDIRMMLALNDSIPLSELEKQLRSKYGADIRVKLERPAS
ncbi:peptidyl-prolyl cis-trans isomerase [Paenibacillus gallinarum]|uniref:peptidylprolyl isomerase n=1 Tax=Paenibacillus gallinarum TaxID=2762232 RepID=A0ABR8T591_9BACL|nr:peptidyl-prolyl cis-trans isomerase [Paenibacillus gallinarum]MBD7970911.1 peptidyl-prolyl cis-trans isomerase [Paenibacillus gallinarum]